MSKHTNLCKQALINAVGHCSKHSYIATVASVTS